MGHKITLSDLGLPAQPQDVVLCQGRVDPLTRQGAFIVKSSVEGDDKGGLKSLDMSYWYRLPSNDAPSKPLSLFKIETDDDGFVTKMTVAGRPVPLDKKSAVQAVKQAIRFVHDDLKVNNLPEIAKILNDSDLHRTIGENIRITGQKIVGGFDFKFMNYFNDSALGAEEDLVLPNDQVMLQALFGIYTNSLSPLTMQEGERDVAASHVATRNSYQNKFKLENGKDGGFSLHASVVPDGQEDEPVYYPDLIDVFTSAAKGEKSDTVKLDRLKLANVDLTNSSNAQKMEAIGAINGMMHAASSYTAPVPLKHMAEYNLLGLTSSMSYLRDGKQDDEFKFLMVSEFGNGLRNIHAGFGNGLGACKRIMAGDIVGMHDFPFEPARDGNEFSGAIPNIGDWKDDIDFIALTHRHIDHVGGIPYEDFSGKKIFCTPQVFEQIKKNLRTAHGSKATQMIRDIDWQLVNKEGATTFSKDGGKSGLTLIYSPNATTHSAYCTPYYYAAFHTDDDGKKHIKGVYVNMGDVRDEDPERINEGFFLTRWREHLLAEHPDLEMSDIPVRPTYADWDSTSVRSEGQTPRINEVLDNTIDAVGWCEGRMILNTHLASSDNMFQILLHTAAHHRRDFTSFGKNMEDTQSIQNIFGYDDLHEPWPKGHQNQIYMDRVHAKNLEDRMAEFEGYDHTDHEFEMALADFEDRYGHFNKIRDSLQKAEALSELGDENSKPRNEQAIFERYTRLTDQMSNLDEKIGALQSQIDALKSSRKKGNAAKAEKLTEEVERLQGNYDEKQVEQERSGLFMVRNYFESIGEPEKRELAELKMKQNMHNDLSDYSQNYWRYARREEWSAQFDIDYRDLGGIVITRNTSTSARMFEEHPENLFVMITGSQGNEVEVEAQLNKILENRALLHGIDPEVRSSARPINKQDTFLFITQSVIPTNEKARNMLVNRAVKEHGFVTFNSTHTGFELYNYHHMKPERLEQIESTLLKKDPLYEKKPRQHVIIAPSMSIGYKGHGRGGDVEPWMTRVRAEINASQHVNNTEAVRVIQTIAKSLKQGTIDLVEDGEVVEIDRFSEERAIRRGKVPRGIVLLRNDQPYQKPFKQIMHREAIKVLEPEGSATHLDPLLAGAPSETTISLLFGLNADAEIERDREPRPGKLQPSFKPAPVDVLPEREEEWAQRTKSAGVAVPGTEKWKTAESLTLKLKR